MLRAENGREALEILGSSPDVDAILMDIMMPEMDGYQTTAQSASCRNSGSCQSSR